MTVRGKPRRRRPGRCLLAIWWPVGMRDALRRAAATEGKSQRQVVEAALRAYFARAEQPPPKTA